MNPSESFVRLAWKEYRVQRPLWLAILALTPVVQGVVAGIAGFRIFNDSPITADGFIVIGLAALAVYWLGCGATLFATEHESGTFDFQRSLPVTARQVFGAKLTVAMGSGLLLAAILWLFTQLTFAHFQASDVQAWIPPVLTAVEVLVWSILFSLLLRQPLWAAVAGVVAPSAVVGLVLPLCLPPAPVSFDLFMYHRSYILERAVLATCVLGVDVALARPWFEGRLRWPGLAGWRRWFRLAEPDYGLAIEMDRPLAAFTGGGQVPTRRLIWMTWRQGRWIVLSAVAVFAVTAMAAAMLPAAERADAWSRPFVAMIAVSMAFGLCTFLFEHWRTEYRFWAERGVSARRLWVVRQVFWFLPLCVMIGVTMAFLLYSPDLAAQSIPAARLFMFVGCVLMPTGLFTVGQFVAMFVPRTIIAVVATLFASFLYYVWFMLMVMGDVPVLWSVAPIPFVLWALTAWYAPHWVEDRLDRRAAWRMTACLLVPGLLIGMAAAAHRAWQIPVSDPGVSRSELTRSLNAQELETAKLYWQAYATLVKSQGQPTDRERGAVLEGLREAHRLPPAPLIDLNASRFSANQRRFTATDSRNPLEFHVATCVQFLRHQASQAMAAGKLDEAGEHYEIALELLRRSQLRMHVLVIRELLRQQNQVLEDLVVWSRHPDQTTERVLKTLRWLEAFERQPPDERTSIEHEYLAMRTLLDGGKPLPAHRDLLDNKMMAESGLIWQLMPWEAERSRRMMDRIVRHELQAYSAWYEQMQRGVGPVGWPHSFPSDPMIMRWQSTTMLPMFSHSVTAALTTVARVGKVRSARLRIALADYHREHDAWPESLGELTSTYFSRGAVPIDPVSGGPPVLFARGVPFEVMDGERRKVPPSSPFLWWAGQSSVVHADTGDGVGRFTRYGRSPIPPATALQMGLIERLE